MLVYHYGYLVILGGLSAAIGLSMRKILPLRLFLLFSAIIFALDGFLNGVYSVALCAAIIGAVNIYNICHYIFQRRTVHLPTEWEQIFERVFYDMLRSDFLYLMRHGTIKTASDEAIITSGEAINFVGLILKGSAEIQLNQEKIVLGPDVFMGEFSYITNSIPSAGITAKGSLEYISWDHATLDNIKKNRSQTYSKFYNAVARNLVHKVDMYASNFTIQ